MFKVLDFKGFDKIYIARGPCPSCNKLTIGWVGFDIWGRRHPSTSFNAVTKRTFQDWERLIKTGKAFKVLSIDKTGKDTKGQPIVSQATLLMSKSPEKVSKQILKRFKDDSQRQKAQPN